MTFKTITILSWKQPLAGTATAAVFGNTFPRDAFAGAGAQNQLLLVVPSLELIVVRFGEQLYGGSKGDSANLGIEQFLFNPVIEAIHEAPYPQSDVISAVEFAPAETVLRLAYGSDNWPVTWAADDNLYTAYGDGNGFLPNTDIKLSLGLCRVEGDPPDDKGFKYQDDNRRKGRGWDVRAESKRHADGGRDPVYAGQES